MTGKAWLAFGVIACGGIAGLSVTAPLFAQQQPVNGSNVKRIEFGTDDPRQVLIMTSPGKWEEVQGGNRVAFRFDEVGRDENTVKLFDRSRNFTITVDLGDRTLSFINDKGEKAVFARNISAEASASVPAAAQKADSAEAPFNPFANSGSAATQSSGKSTPPFLRNQTGGGAAATPAATGSPYVGPWVSTSGTYQKSGDGVSGPVTWSAPEVIMVTSPDPATLRIHFDNLPNISLTLQRVNDTMYSGGGNTAVFTPLGKEFTLRLEGAVLGSKEFTMAKTGDGVLSRDRFDIADKDNRRGLFNQDGLAREWNNLSFGRDGPSVDLFDSLAGRKAQIFKQPGGTDYASDDNLGKSLPYGIRGERMRTSKSQQMETMISNAASFQKSMSYNFGGSAGDPAKGSLGINVAREESSGSDQSAGRMKGLGLSRIERYALIVDKANLELDPLFKQNVQRLAQGSMSPAQFRERYGTHYANAIHLGGLGKAEKTMTSRELKDFVKASTSVSGSGGAKGVTLTGGFSTSTGATTGTNSMFSREDWSAVGGSGSMTSAGWTVSDDDTVPVRYDLRPLSDLISPIFFKEEWDGPARASYVAARQKLETEINRYMAGQPRLSDEPIGPLVYRLTFHSLKCMNNGDEGKKTAALYGEIKASINSMDGPQELTLFSAPEANPKEISCSGGAELPIDQSALVVGPRSGNNKAFFMLSAPGLNEDDNSVTDLDDPVMAWPPKPVILSDWKADEPRIDMEGTIITNIPPIKYGPDLRVRVSFSEVR